jgi:hypothetical protein
MLVFRGTRKLLKEVGVSATGLDDPGEGLLGSWFGHVFRIERRKCVIFTNDPTLYSVLLYGLRKPDLEAIGERFTERLVASLQGDGFPSEQIASIGMACHPVVWATTNNRSVLGSVNDLISLTKHAVARRRQETEQEMADFGRQINRIPWSSLKSVFATEALKAELEGWTP